ncbi:MULTISPECIES: acyl carrier protein [unclassified Micromonospora]|uniref:acyl carrier protein n=1 Tax=unclassified Micromonospora TaxID=2617518 RepID=UPI0024171777|nr:MULTISPECIES: acyl carrier protein [unclassified Micromonospora]MDG4820136.1 acyl carrier protein [Micromonospora sp. WMMD956]WFE56548.1 acyl carrier protein [Micromonospora sp. WMMD712]
MNEPATIRAELLDCVQVNLAVLADRWHGTGTHLRLGASLELRPRPGADGLPTVEPAVREHLAEATDRLGVGWCEPGAGHRPATPTTPDTGPLRHTDGAGLVAEVTEHGLCYVVADAYHLRWVPYHGQRHIEHSFLIEPDGSGFAVTDAYHNDTPWGAARPGRWTLTGAELAAAVPDGAVVAGPVPGELPAAPQPGYAVDAATVDAYVDAYRAYPDRVVALDALTLQTWLLARQRRLHAAYRAAHRGGAETAAEAAQLARWDRVVEQTYLAARRVQRGRPEPAGLLATFAEALDTDRSVFAAAPARPAPPAAVAGTVRPELSAEVTEVVRSVLQLDDTGPGLTAATALDTVPSFSSFRMVEIVDRLEQRFRIEFHPDDLVPERLHRVADLCEIVLRASPRQEAGATPSGGSHAA